MMSRYSAPLAAFGLGALALAACAPEAPNAYSPGYSRIAVTEGGASGGAVRKGYDRTTGSRRTALVPDACITPDVAPDPLYLPSGCANAVNLQQMAERERDLERGREPGPAMAAPTVRAANRYLNGTGDDDRRRRLDRDDPATDSYRPYVDTTTSTAAPGSTTAP